MSTTVSTVDVCPQQILSFNAPTPLVQDVLNNVLKEEWQRNDNNYFTQDTFLHKKQQYEQLISWFNDCLQYTAQRKRYMFRGKFTITQCWANKTTTNGSHHIHNHPNSLLSGIFYLNDSTPTRFLQPLVWDVPLIQTMNDESTTSTVQSECGKLLIFPSTLLHGTDAHTTTEDRYSMSFNTFIQGELGDVSSLDYVSINNSDVPDLNEWT
tara:strand:+ start:2413 stop:3042 length:630 start_codon:yes stop_codon:yes gene_type:complete